MNDALKSMVCFMIKEIGLNKEKYLNQPSGVDWDDIAATVWNKYPGIVNEFLINDAIDIIMQAAEETQGNG